MLSFLRKNPMIPSDEQLDTINHFFSEAMNNQNILTTTMQYFIQMADFLPCALWIKDDCDRYIFANKNLRSDLFNGVPLPTIMGKSDVEMVDGTSLSEENICQFIDIQPDQLPNIMQYLEKETRICTLTDIVTRSFRHDCLFIERVDNLTLLVSKQPIVKNNKLIGTIGFYSKLVNEESSLNLLIEKYEADGVAYRIDSTESFYLSVPFDNKFVLENFI